MATHLQCRSRLERLLVLASARSLSKPDVGALVQAASEFADSVHVPLVNLTGVPWTEKPETIGRWYNSLNITGRTVSGLSSQVAATESVDGIGLERRSHVDY